jgi:uncharacterized membrane-anchored protein
MTVPKGANPLMDFGFGPAPTKDAKEPEHKKKEKTPTKRKRKRNRRRRRRRPRRTRPIRRSSSDDENRDEVADLVAKNKRDCQNQSHNQNQNRSAGVVVGGDAFGFEEDHGGYVHRSPPPGDGHGARVVARAAQTEAPERGQGRVEADG